MQYVKKSDTPPAGVEQPADVTVHVLGEKPASSAVQQKGTATDTGPKGADKFPSTDTWQGKPITSDYQTIPTDKDAIEENLKAAGAEVQSRFGLEQRGIPPDPAGEPDKGSDTGE